MTTIAYRDGVLAGDCRAQSNNGWIGSETTRKVFRLPDGRLVGFAGGFAEGWSFLRWLRGGMNGDRPKLTDSIVVVVENARRITVYQDGGDFPMDGRHFHAWGSGFPAALAAMHAGVDAVMAVKIAAKVDNSTNAKVYSVSLSKKKA